MKVLITTSTFPVRLDDGVPRFVYDLAQSLTRHAEVTVLAPDAPGAARSEQIGALGIRRATYFWPRNFQRLALGEGMRDNLRASMLARMQVPLFLASQALTTRRLATRLDIDVVNAHWLVPQGLTAALARGRRPRFRLVLHVHAGDVYFLQKWPLGRATASFVMSRTDAVFADGSHVRDSLSELLGADCGATLQPNGVHTRVFGPSADGKVTRPPVPEEVNYRDGYVLFFGRLSEKKGAIYLVRAMPRVLDRYPEVGLVVIGDGPEYSALRDEIRRLGIQESVTLLGRKSHEEIVRYLHPCRVAAVPSIIDSHGETEGMPTVVVEAMAAGVRVVGSAVDGIPDVLRHGDNGWLCREKDPDDLAEKILMALEDSPQSRITRQALETAADLDWERVAERYYTVFQQVLGQSKR